MVGYYICRLHLYADHWSLPLLPYAAKNSSPIITDHMMFVFAILSKFCTLLSDYTLVSVYDVALYLVHIYVLNIQETKDLSTFLQVIHQ